MLLTPKLSHISGNRGQDSSAAGTLSKSESVSGNGAAMTVLAIKAVRIRANFMLSFQKGVSFVFFCVCVCVCVCVCGFLMGAFFFSV